MSFDGLFKSFTPLVETQSYSELKLLKPNELSTSSLKENSVISSHIFNSFTDLGFKPVFAFESLDGNISNSESNAT